MLSYIRRRASFVNVVAVLALVFAMTGGALAAKKYLITSTKQISPKVLAQLKGLNGKNGAPGGQGPQGVPGAQGPVGTNGTNGTNGANGTNGSPGATGVTGAKGQEGLPGLKGGTGPTGSAGVTGPAGTTGSTGPEGICSTASCILPSGATETGTWSTTLYGLPKERFPAGITISFAIPLKEASPENEEHAFFFTAKETEEIRNGNPKDGCSGTVEAPTAPPGKLCIYTLEEENGSTSQFSFVVSPAFGLGQFAKTGTVVNLETKAEPSHMEARGTWAVTAP